MGTATYEHCPTDKYNRHDWKSIGVLVKEGVTYQIHKCNQCGYCYPEKLMFVHSIYSKKER